MALDTPTTPTPATTTTDEAGDDGSVEGGDSHQSSRPVGPARSRRPLSSRTRFGLVVLAAFVVGLGVRVAIGLTDDAPATDVTAYLRSGLSLADGEGFRRDGRAELHFPPLVPFLFSLTSRIFSDPLDGVIALTALSSTLMIVPLALLARRAAGPVAGAVTAWVAALTPGLSTTLVNRGGGSEAEYALLVVSALWLVAAAADERGRRRVGLATGAGLCVGLAYLTRPEGLFLAAPLGITLVLLAKRDAQPGKRLRSIVPLTAGFMLPIVICIVPYAMYLHDNTGKWQLSAKTQDASIEAWRAVANNDRQKRDSVLYALDESGLHFTAGRTSLLGLARDDPSGYLGIVTTNATRFVDEVAMPESRMWLGWLLLPLPLWGLAAVGARRFGGSRTVRLLLAVSAIPIGTTLIFFVQPRYLVVVCALATVLVGVAVPALSRRSRPWIVTGTFVFLALSLIQGFRGPAGWWHPGDHTDQRLAGEWIRANTDPDARIMTRSMVVEFYADRDTMALPYAEMDRIVAYGQHYCAGYLVIDQYTVTNLRPQIKVLRTQDNAPGLQLVHEVTAEGRSTRVFAFEPTPAGPCAPIGSSLGFVGDGPPAAEA